VRVDNGVFPLRGAISYGRGQRAHGEANFLWPRTENQRDRPTSEKLICQGTTQIQTAGQRFGSNLKRNKVKRKTRPWMRLIGRKEVVAAPVGNYNMGGIVDEQMSQECKFLARNGRYNAEIVDPGLKETMM